MREYSAAIRNLSVNPRASFTLHDQSRNPAQRDFMSHVDRADRSTVPGAFQERPAEAKRVLVVDDEHLIADTLARILNLSGFVAHAVYSGEAALEVLPALCPDIVLTDVRMPGRNGIETGILIRSRCPQTRVVLFSGQAGVGTMTHTAKNDGHGFELWPKPIHPKELLKRLREL